jgi:predicted DNA-binding antitoxin AbrB/MazE fold protein
MAAEVTAMAITVDGVYEGNGVVKLDQPVAIKEKTKVHVTIEADSESAQDDDPTGWKAAERFIGMWKDAPARSSTSLSEDHDRVIYKRK